MNNEERAESVEAFIKGFARDMGLDIDPEADGPSLVVGDMIGNMLHWLSQNSPDGFEEALRSAKNGVGQFVQETFVPDDLGPDAFVSFEVAYEQKLWTVGATGTVTFQDEAVIPNP